MNDYVLQKHHARDVENHMRALCKLFGWPAIRVFACVTECFALMRVFWLAPSLYECTCLCLGLYMDCITSHECSMEDCFYMIKLF